jgi:hypothetical protein
MTARQQKVFGVGWAKTGTTTLGRCLTELGFDHQGRAFELLDDLATGDKRRVHDVVARHDSFDDWPWILLFRELDAGWPGSRFVLTIREPDEWLRSYRNMLRAPGANSPRETARRRQIYGLPFPDVTDAQLLERYERHNQEVMSWFVDRPEALLVVDWSKGDGWPELCGFLGRPVPDGPFPWANQGDYRRRPLPRVVRRMVRGRR